jgi:acetyl-CoA synthetase
VEQYERSTCSKDFWSAIIKYKNILYKETIMSRSTNSWEEAAFYSKWNVPEYYNMADVLADQHMRGGQDGAKTALIVERANGKIERWTYAVLSVGSDRLANAFYAMGARTGRSIAIVLPPGPELILATLAAYKIGAIATPFRPSTSPRILMRYLDECAPDILVAEPDILNALYDELGHDLQDMHPVASEKMAYAAFKVGILQDLIKAAPKNNRPELHLKSSDPAVLLYGACRLNPILGIMHGHRLLEGCIPSWRQAHMDAPQPSDVYWNVDFDSPYHLLNLCVPLPLARGATLLITETPPKNIAHVINTAMSHGVRNLTLSHKSLHTMKAANLAPDRSKLVLRSLCTYDAPMDAAHQDWLHTHLGVRATCLTGTPECPHVYGIYPTEAPKKYTTMVNNPPLEQLEWHTTPAGYPGHMVDVVDNSGRLLAANKVGLLAIRSTDPALALNYWMNQHTFERRFAGAMLSNNKPCWFLTGDVALRQDDGRLNILGRREGAIRTPTGGISPNEIENIINAHPSVQTSIAYATEGYTKFELANAYVLLKKGAKAPEDALKAELKAKIDAALGQNAVPEHIIFEDPA